MEKSNEVGNLETNTPEVNQVQTSTPQPTSGVVPEQPLTESKLSQSTNKKWLVPGLVGLVVVTLSVAGYFAYQYFQLKKERPELPQIKTTTSNSPSPTINPTAGWSEYTNQKHGFSLKYPSSVYVKETNGVNTPLVFLDTKPVNIPSSYGGQLTPVEIRTAPIIKQSTAEEAALISKSLFIPDTYSEKQITEPAKGIVVSGTGQGFGAEGSNYTKVFLENSNGLVAFDFQENDLFSQELFNQILSTFKFTDQAVDTIDWKTDINLITANTMGESKNYTYVVSYPDGWIISKDSSTHNNDDLVSNCVDYNIVSPSGTKVALQPTCTSWVGNVEDLPAEYSVVEDLGTLGNDAHQSYLIRFNNLGTDNYQYGIVSTKLGQSIRLTDKVEKTILVYYAPDDWYFIPTTVKAVSDNSNDLLVVDQIATKLLLEKK